MLLRPLRRAPMMLGGVGFQAGMAENRREWLAARQTTTPGPDVVAQLKELKALRDDGTLSPEEFVVAKRKVLGG
jgi:hypothetical protein